MTELEKFTPFIKKNIIFNQDIIPEGTKVICENMAWGKSYQN